jgi:hypothetical protein
LSSLSSNPSLSMLMVKCFTNLYNSWTVHLVWNHGAAASNKKRYSWYHIQWKVI